MCPARLWPSLRRRRRPSLASRGFAVRPTGSSNSGKGMNLSSSPSLNFLRRVQAAMSSQMVRGAYIYVSGALSGLSVAEFARVTAIYDVIADAADQAAITAYRPHRSPTAPGNQMEPSTVWRTDYARVTESDLVVAYVGVPAFGVGSEIEMARTAGVAVILVCVAARLAGVSRLVLGSPAVEKVLTFEDHADLSRSLADAIRSVRTRPLYESAYGLGQLADERVASAKRKARRKPARTEGY